MYGSRYVSVSVCERSPACVCGVCCVSMLLNNEAFQITRCTLVKIGLNLKKRENMPEHVFMKFDIFSIKFNIVTDIKIEQ